MMKGADAAFLVVCNALKLQTKARPAYRIEEHWEDWYDSDDPESDFYKGKFSYLDPLSIFGVTTDSTDHLAKGKDIWLGSKFRKFKADEQWGDPHSWVLSSLRDDTEYVYDNVKGIHWLNKPKFVEAELAFPSVI